MFGTWVLGWEFHSRLDVNRNEARFFSVVAGPAAPRLIFRMPYEAANNGIRVHEIELFRLLSAGADVEIVKSRLPESPQRFSCWLAWQDQLSGAKRSFSLAQHLRCTHLYFLKHRRRRPQLRPTDQKMDMFGHDDLTNERKTRLVAYVCQLFHEDVPGSRALQQRQPSVTTESNKVQVAFAVEALPSGWHRKPHGRKRHPQDPGTQHRNLGHPPPLYTFPRRDTVISSPRFFCQRISFLQPGPPATCPAIRLVGTPRRPLQF
jgi:hypothetical protein